MSELLTAVLSGIGGMLGWGFSDFFSAKAIKKDKLSENSANFLLFSFLSVIVWVVVLISGESIQAISLSTFLTLALLAGGNFLAFVLFFKALNMGSLSTISTIFSTYGVGTALVSFLFFGEEISLFRFFAIVIVFLGISAVSVQDIKSFKTIKGLKYVLLAALSLSIVFPLWDNFLGKQTGFLYWLALFNSIIALLFFAIIKLSSHEKIKLSHGTKPMILSALTYSIGTFATTWGFKATTLTSVVVVVSSAIPLVSVVLGYFAFKEKLILTQYIGIAGIILGTVLLFWS